MPNTEIDDIFSGKSKTKIEGMKVVSSSSQIPDNSSGKKKKKKKTKQEATGAESAKDKNQEQEKITKTKQVTGVSKDGKRKRSAEPEEIVDPSLQTKRRKLDAKGSISLPKKLKKDEIAKFKDSRGKAGSEPHVAHIGFAISNKIRIPLGKRTDEGFLIYTEEELGLNKEGGVFRSRAKNIPDAQTQVIEHPRLESTTLFMTKCLYRPSVLKVLLGKQGHENNRFNEPKGLQYEMWERTVMDTGGLKSKETLSDDR
ncbi:hypothetical protein FRC16_005359 [Serendipita sp. 398]|nr:hypothetical protein FRC16_005359 [Serendipita sp. 398]